MKSTLLFIYNADSSLFAAASDFARRILKPDEYQCNLCMVTYGKFGTMKNEWKQFIDSLDQPVQFLHRDEFKEKYPNETTALPAIFLLKKETVELLISHTEIDGVRSVPEMITLIKNKLS